MTNECECWPVENPWTYHGITEPGGALEHNPDCPEHGDPPLTWTQRAQQVQDDIGWADPSDPSVMASTVLALARLVTDMARELDKAGAST